MKKLLVAIVMAGLAVVATSSVAGACFLWAYQPKTPKCLRK